MQDEARGLLVGHRPNLAEGRPIADELDDAIVHDLFARFQRRTERLAHGLAGAEKR